jgi:hypothetical protein
MAAPVQHVLDQFRRIVDQDMVAQLLWCTEAGERSATLVS